jgi:O-antigen/teichoic acid export membrane protein
MNNQPVTEPQKFASDVVWVAVSQALVLLTGLGTLPALTKCYSAEIYGAWVQIVVTVGLMTLILALYLQNATVRFLAAEEDTEKRRRAFGAMLWPILAFACFLVIVSLLLRQDLSILMFADSKYAYLIPLIFLWASMEALFAFSLSYLLARGKIKRLSIIQISLAITKMAVIVMLALAGYGLGWIIVCIIASETFFVIVVFGMIIKEIGWPRPALEGLRGYLAFSIPQIPSGILLWVIGASDRYFITHLLNLSQTGIYSASYAIGSLISLFYFPLHVVLFPTVSRLWEQEELSKVRNYLEYSTKLFLTLALPGAAGLYILSQPLLGILTTSDYLVGGRLILLVALGIMLLGVYQINSYVILLVKQTKWLPLIVAIAAVTNAGFNLTLIPKVGIMGAAISAIVSYFILAAIVTVWARRVISYKVDIKFLAKVIAGTLLMAFCLSFINISGILGIIITAVAGVMIFALALWLLKAFSTEDRKLIKEIILGLKQGALLR